MLISRTIFQHKACWFWLILIHHKESYDLKCEGGVWISGFQFEEKMAALLAYFRLSLTHASQNSFLFCLFLHLGVHSTYTKKKSRNFCHFFLNFFIYMAKMVFFAYFVFIDLIFFSYSHFIETFTKTQQHSKIWILTKINNVCVLPAHLRRPKLVVECSPQACESRYHRA